MHNLIIVCLYVFVTLGMFVMSIFNSPLGEEAPADFHPGKLSAVDIAILVGGTDCAAHVMIVDMLCRGSARVVRQGRWLRHHLIKLNEPLSSDMTPSIFLANGLYRRSKIVHYLKDDISLERNILVENGLLLSFKDTMRTIAWTSYPLAASTGLGLFLLSLFPNGSWPRTALTICLICGLVAIRLVNVDVGRTPSGTAARDAVRSLYANHLTPPLAYAVALWGLERLRSTPFEAYADMVEAETAG